MKKSYQGTQDRSKRKYEVISKREMVMEVPLPMVEVWEEMQAQVEELTGHAIDQPAAGPTRRRRENTSYR